MHQPNLSSVDALKSVCLLQPRVIMEHIEQGCTQGVMTEAQALQMLGTCALHFLSLTPIHFWLITGSAPEGAEGWAIHVSQGCARGRAGEGERGQRMRSKIGEGWGGRAVGAGRDG